MGVLPSPALHYLWVGESYATVSPAGRILRADGSRAGLRAAPRTKRAPDGQMATQGAHSRGNLAAPAQAHAPDPDCSRVADPRRGRGVRGIAAGHSVGRQCPRPRPRAGPLPSRRPPVPPRFAASIEATEDHRFGYEPGVDPFAIARVTASWLTGGGTANQGGATIYQQLAQPAYTRERSGPAAELEQVSLAVKLFMTYSSQQILQMYSDVAYFGNGDYGIAAASCGYFGVPPASMSWPQAALLAGLVQGPSEDDPLQHPVQARQREAHVIGRLAATRQITPQEAPAAVAVPLCH